MILRNKPWLSLVGTWTFTIGLAALQLACQQQLSDERRVLSSRDAPGSGSRQNDDETVTPPTNVSGTYLFCQPLLENVQGQPVNRAGCSIIEPIKGEKVAIESLAESVEWGFQRDPLSNIEAEVSVQSAEAQYHAIYTFRVAGGEAPNLGANNSRITATIIGLPGQDENLVLESALDRLILEYLDSRILDVFIPVFQ